MYDQNAEVLIRKYGPGVCCSIVGGTAMGYVLCPILSYLMGMVPVPYGWISDFPEQYRLLLFLAGAFLLFVVASIFTVGLFATVIGFYFKSQVLLTSALVSASATFTYCCFVLDQSVVTNFSSWIIHPMNWFYLMEIAALLLLCVSMVWFGSILGWIREYWRENLKQPVPDA